MAELDSDWYFGSRVSNEETNSDFSESSDEIFINTRNRLIDDDMNDAYDTTIKDTESHSLIIDLDSDSEESDSSLEVISLELNKLKQEQIRLALLNEKSSNTAETLQMDMNEK